MPLRVLFVDDEVRVLEALERVLFDCDEDWSTRFVNGGQQALQALAEEPYDVTVSDLRMSGVDGVALLTQVRDLYPQCVRIVLSGHSDEEAALKMVKVTHQFLAKPCGADTLRQVIGRAEELSRMLTEPRLRALVGRVSGLPVAGHVYESLTELLSREEPDAALVAATIRQDPGMTSKLLQVASSAFFNTSASVADVETAIMRLGFRTLRNLLESSAFEPLPRDADRGPVTVESLQRRSLDVARVAASMAKLPEDAALAYMAGLLCDVGQLVLLVSSPEWLYMSQADATRSGSPVHEAERATFHTTHAEVGAYLLGLWGLPHAIVQAAAQHHQPELHGEHVGTAQLVWLASCIVEGHAPAPESLHRFGMEQLYERTRREFEKQQS
jgi:HD-like signal output (HDOD) protein